MVLVAFKIIYYAYICAIRSVSDTEGNSFGILKMPAFICNIGRDSEILICIYSELISL